MNDLSEMEVRQGLDKRFPQFGFGADALPAFYNLLPALRNMGAGVPVSFDSGG